MAAPSGARLLNAAQGRRLDLTAESAGGVRTVVVVPCCLTGLEVSELHKSGTTVDLSATGMTSM